MSMRHLLPLATLPLLVAASAPTALRPGWWRITSTPTAATLDGRRLADLPYAPPPPEEVCLSPEQGRDPARWFTRDSAPGCVWNERSVAGGRVSIVGSCPAEETGQPAGSTRLFGRWTAEGYTIHFATLASGSNGRMGLDGSVTAKRLGDCPN